MLLSFVSVRRALLAIVATLLFVSNTAWADKAAFSPAPGNFTAPPTVTITDHQTGGTIYYTIDGTNPETSPTAVVYGAPFVLPPGTITVMAADDVGGTWNNIATATYSSPSSGTGVITVNAGTQVPINPLVYGANNMWYYIQGSSFHDYATALQGAGVTMIRFPGGYESEHYIWDVQSPVCNSPCTANDNDEFTYDANGNVTTKPYTYYWGNNNYPNAPWTPGASATQAISQFNNSVAFTLRTADALTANTTAKYQTWANYAAHLVTKYGASVTDWLIGNEWYNDTAGGGNSAHSNTATWAANYGTLLAYYVPAMIQAASTNHYPIRIWVSAEWTRPQDLAAIINAANSGPSGSGVWSEVYGLDLHIYSGNNPLQNTNPTYNSCQGGYWIPLPTSQVSQQIQVMQNAASKTPVFVSEWAADRGDNAGPDCTVSQPQTGLENSNDMLQLFGQFAQAGVNEATYWPPAIVTPWGGATINGVVTPVTNDNAQADKLTFLSTLSSPMFAVDADGQAMSWLSANYRGYSLPTSVNNTAVTSIAAKNGNQVVVFIMGGGSAFDQAEQVQVSGFSWSSVVSAQVLYAAAGQDPTTGPATVANITATAGMVGGVETAQFTINPGTTGRGSGWEIVKLVLQ